MKYHRWGGLNDRNLFSHRSGYWRSKIKVSIGLVSVRPLSLACRGPPSSCLHIAFPLRVRIPGLSFSYKDSSHIRLSPTHMNSFNVNYLLEALFPNKSLGIRAPTYKF